MWPPRPVQVQANADLDLAGLAGDGGDACGGGAGLLLGDGHGRERSGPRCGRDARGARGLEGGARVAGIRARGHDPEREDAHAARGDEVVGGVAHHPRAPRPGAPGRVDRGGAGRCVSRVTTTSKRFASPKRSRKRWAHVAAGPSRGPGDGRDATPLGHPSGRRARARARCPGLPIQGLEALGDGLEGDLVPGPSKQPLRDAPVVVGVPCGLMFHVRAGHADPEAAGRLDDRLAVAARDVGDDAIRSSSRACGARQVRAWPPASRTRGPLRGPSLGRRPPGPCGRGSCAARARGRPRRPGASWRRVRGRGRSSPRRAERGGPPAVPAPGRGGCARPAPRRRSERRRPRRCAGVRGRWPPTRPKPGRGCLPPPADAAMRAGPGRSPLAGPPGPRP